MADLENIIFQIGEGDPFQLDYNPKEIEPEIIDHSSTFMLHDGVEATNHISNIVQFTLTWEAPVYMDDEQYQILKELWLTKNSFYIYPDPLNYSDIYWLVKFKSGSSFNLKSATGQLDGWGWHGKIILIGARVETDDDISDNWKFGKYGVELS